MPSQEEFDREVAAFHEWLNNQKPAVKKLTIQKKLDLYEQVPGIRSDIRAVLRGVG